MQCISTITLPNEEGIPPISKNKMGFANILCPAEVP
jgi:hypothetical protein